LLSRQNLQTEESNENNWDVRQRLKDIIEPYVDEVIQPRGFLSCHLVTCTELLMEQESRLVDRYLRPLFYPLNDIMMKWPFFLTFVTISSNQGRMKSIIE
jgi:hypothetical protein